MLLVVETAAERLGGKQRIEEEFPGTMPRFAAKSSGNGIETVGLSTYP